MELIDFEYQDVKEEFITKLPGLSLHFHIERYESIEAAGFASNVRFTIHGSKLPSTITLGMTYREMWKILTNDPTIKEAFNRTANGGEWEFVLNGIKEVTIERSEIRVVGKKIVLTKGWEISKQNPNQLSKFFGSGILLTPQGKSVKSYGEYNQEVGEYQVQNLDCLRGNYFKTQKGFIIFNIDPNGKYYWVEKPRRAFLRLIGATIPEVFQNTNISVLEHGRFNSIYWGIIPIS